MRFWVGCVALAILAAAPALAAPGSVSGTTQLPFRLDGNAETRAQDASFVIAGDDGQVAFLLQGYEGKATRIIHRAFGIVSTDPDAEVLWSHRVDTVELDLKGGLLSLLDRKPTFTLLAYDAAGAHATEQDAMRFGELAKPIRIDARPGPPFAVRWGQFVEPFRHEIPAGTFTSTAMDARLSLDGPLRLFVAGATLQWHDGQRNHEVKAYERDEEHPGALYNPLDGTWFGAGSHTERVTEYLLVEVTGHMDLRHDGIEGRFLADDASLRVQGTALLPRMTGSVTIQGEDGATHRLEGQDLVLKGDIQIQAQPSHDGRARIVASGDIQTVSYGAVRAHYDWTPVAVGLGALAVAAAAWLASNGKALLGVAGAVAGYARVHGDGILEHPGRAEVYERVKAFPGVNFVQLSREVPFGASTLNYHLRVLERNGYVTSVRDGRYLRFFDRTTGTYSGNRKMAVSALRNEKSASIAKHIRDHPGITQSALAAAFAVTPSTISWHVNRLSGQGLVLKQRHGQNTRYYLGDAWAQLPMEEQARQESQSA
jgi:DNA-binding transcriptional ArsR family regulator